MDVEGEEVEVEGDEVDVEVNDEEGVSGEEEWGVCLVGSMVQSSSCVWIYVLLMEELNILYEANLYTWYIEQM